MSNLKHIFIDGYVSSLPYSTFGGGVFPKRDISNRIEHGTRIQIEFQSAVNDFDDLLEYEFVCVEFESAINFELDIDKFENAKGDIKLASSKRFITMDSDGLTESIIFKSIVYLKKNGVVSFLKKLEEYLTKNTKKKTDPVMKV